MQGMLGGGEGIEGTYGSLTQAGMRAVLAALKGDAGMDSDSVLVDVGAGLGRFVFTK
jgi:hypothetical protein